MGTRRAWLRGAGTASAVLIVAGAVAYGVAVDALRTRLEAALGPRGTVAAIEMDWSGVAVEDLRVASPEGWPARETFRAERVAIVPRPRSLFSDRWWIWSVTATKPYISVVRAKGRKLSALPGVFPDAARPAEARADPPKIWIHAVELEDGVLEIFDESAGPPPVKLRLEQVEAKLHDVDIPALRGRSAFTLDAVVKGKAHDGRAHVAGWAELATRDCSITTELRSVDLVILEPYLIRKGETGIRAGSLDLDMRSNVQDGRLSAPGKITITGLELAPAEGVLGTFMGISRTSLLTGLHEKGGKVEMDFTLEGDVRNPRFSFDETLTTKLAYSLAKALGVSLQGLAEGVGTMGLKGGEAAGEAAEGIGGALEDLFEGRPKK
jgi:hypothetical protein